MLLSNCGSERAVSTSGGGALFCWGRESLPPVFPAGPSCCGRSIRGAVTVFSRPPYVHCKIIRLYNCMQSNNLHQPCKYSL